MKHEVKIQVLKVLKGEKKISLKSYDMKYKDYKFEKKNKKTKELTKLKIFYLSLAMIF